jgi:hypothetical protein
LRTKLGPERVYISLLGKIIIMTKFTYDEIVRIKSSATPNFRAGGRAWIVGVIEDRRHFSLRQFPPGVVYSIEFENGDALDVFEDDLERWVDT